MLQKIKSSIAVAGLVALAISAVATQANAFFLRVPQVPVLGGTLQGYLNSKGETINVLTDQMDAQVWSSSASGNSLLTLMVELTAAPINNIGIYNAGVAAPPLYQIFPGAASAGWYAVMSFLAGPPRVVVTLFDNNSVIQGQIIYIGADANNFGFYLQNPSTGAILYSQDARNAGSSAQMLAYQGTGINFGEWWLCFEETALGAGSDRDYDDAVMILESVNPLATEAKTLGAVKALYR